MATPESCAVYTCVTNGYDRVIPPRAPVPGVDHILFTDDPDRDATPGWITRPIDTGLDADLSPALRNRYYKLLPHKVLPDYATSVYLDANIAITASLAPFLVDVFGGPENLSLFRHPSRTTVAAEMQACLDTGRVRNPDALRHEVAGYARDGFPDTVPLTGNSILARRHHAPDIVAAMDMWWDVLERGGGRDQISLPYVRWKLDLPVRVLTPHFSIESPFFLRYPHWTSSGRRGRAYIAAARRQQDGWPFRVAHALIGRSYRNGASF